MDIGSGKGYLSQHLALQYGLSVVGVDAEEINTLGAETRNRKVLDIHVVAPHEGKDQHPCNSWVLFTVYCLLQTNQGFFTMYRYQLSKVYQLWNLQTCS